MTFLFSCNGFYFLVFGRASCPPSRYSRMAGRNSTNRQRNFLLLLDFRTKGSRPGSGLRLFDFTLELAVPPSFSIGESQNRRPDPQSVCFSYKNQNTGVKLADLC